MFSFGRKSKKGQREDSPATIRSRPSLPELHSQGIPWPETLVDISSIRQAQVPERERSERRPQGTPLDGRTIAALYMSGPAPPPVVRPKPTSVSGRPGPRRAHLPPTFNLMVVGGRGTGKTSLLRLLLETAEISPTATLDQQLAMDRFLHGKAKLTRTIQTACVEICESRYDRLLFSVVDTPGLDFIEGRELKLERQITAILKYVDTQFSDTMNEESKVIRQNKGDQHIHLCIYMIDPSSVMSTSARRAQSLLPLTTKSETTISYHPPDVTSTEGEDEDDEEDELTLPPAEIRVIRRLSERANVLPVVARADSLTDEKLLAVKAAVRRALGDAGLDFGVFAPARRPVNGAHKKPNGARHTNGAAAPAPDSETEDEEEEEEEEGGVDEGGRTARPVIKLRPSRHSSARRSRSRSRRRELSPGGAGDALDWTDKDSVASVRFSAHIVGRRDLGSTLPFALIAPEERHRRRHTGHVQRPDSVASHTTVSRTVEGSTAEGGMEDSTVDGHTMSMITSPMSVSGYSMKNFPYLQGPPDDLKGVFTRKFRWGTIDVLNPEHCDFAALRTAVLSTHLKALKTRTNEVLYERFRTEKLLARRAANTISEVETKKLLEELGL